MPVSPTVSIVVPLHDGSGTVGETLASIRAQSFGDWELIVVDDASGDGGPDLVAGLTADIDQPVHLLASERAGPIGPSATRNRGLAVATGVYVAFLDADDTWDPAYLARRVTALDDDDDGLVLVWGPVLYWYPDDPGASFAQPNGLPESPTRFAPAAPIARWLLDLRGTPCPSATVFRREAMKDSGGYPEELWRGEDVAACIAVAADHPTAYDPAVLVRYRRHAASATSRDNRSGRRTERDVAFGRWVVAFVGARPDLAGLRPVAARCLHGLVHRAVDGRSFVTARTEITRTMLGSDGSRSRWWAVGLDVVLPLRWSRRVAGRLERVVRDDGQ